MDVIAIDLADVIQDTWNDKRRFITEHAGIDPGPVPLSGDYVIKKFANGDVRFYQELVKHVFHPKQLINHQPIHNSVESIKLLREKAEVHILTFREEKDRELTENWLELNDLGEFKDTLSMLDHNESKIEWCNENNAVAIVDNRAQNLLGRSDSKLKRILFSKHDCEVLPSGALRCCSWGEVLEILMH